MTYYGHSTLLVEADGKRLLFDPFITPNPKAAGVDVASLKPDAVLLTHGHADHVADAEEILKQSGAHLVSTFEVVTWFQNKGIENATPMNHGGSRTFPFGRVSLVNAVHSSSMPDGSYGGHPAGFVVETGEGVFYISGDTALTYDMKIIARRWHLDWAGLCLGDHFTMGPEDAATAARWTSAPRVIGMHYDTFPPIEIDHQAAHKYFEALGVELLLPGIGETVSVEKA